RRGALGCVRRSNDEAPPRQLGAARRAGRGDEAGRRRGVSGIQRHPVFRRDNKELASLCALTGAASMPASAGGLRAVAAVRRTNCVLPRSLARTKPDQKVKQCYLV